MRIPVIILFVFTVLSCSQDPQKNSIISMGIGKLRELKGMER
jgi:hypothetical protein